MDSIFVFVLWQELLDGIVEKLSVALGIIDASISQILVNSGQIVQINVKGNLLSVSQFSQLF